MFFPLNGDDGPKLPRPSETWLLTEGCKDAATAHSLGYLVAGLPSDKFAAKYAHLFKGVNVVLVPDLDAPSEAGMNQAARRLYGIAQTISIVRLPGEFGSKHDLRDVLRRLGRDAIRQAVEGAVEWEPTDDEGGDAIPGLLSIRGRTDLANGQRLIARHGEDLRFIGEWGKWMAWDGRRWKQDAERRVEHFAKSTAEWVLDQFESNGGDAKFATDTASARGIRDMIAMARSDPAVSLSYAQLDQQHWLFNCQNGTLDLKTGELRSHTRDDCLTKLAPAEYHDGAESSLWLSFLDDVLGADKELLTYVQRLVGLSLTGSVRDHVLPILWGTGRNGKSTFLSTVQRVVGSYAVVADKDLLIARRHESHPTSLADLFGRRLVTCIETEENVRLNEVLVKRLTGGDGEQIAARRMREDFWRFDPTWTIGLATNHKPVIQGTDLGIWRRIRLVPFTVTIPPESVDAELPMKLRRKGELSGILSWAVQGCLDWQREGINEPACVTEATERYRGEMDEVVRWVSDDCVLHTSARLPVAKGFEAYKAWGGTLGRRRFSDRLEQTHQKRRCNECGFQGQQVFFGIGLKASSEV